MGGDVVISLFFSIKGIDHSKMNILSFTHDFQNLCAVTFPVEHNVTFQNTFMLLLQYNNCYTNYFCVSWK